MKKSLLFLLLAFMPMLQTARAQELKTTFSPTFEEPEDLDARIFQSRVGNTLLFFFTKAGIRVTVYDAARKPIARTLLTGATLPAGAVKQSQLTGLFNLGNEVVMFVQRTTGQNPGLYRLSISPADGKLVNATKVADIGEYKSGSAFAMAFGGVKEKSFYVQKDNGSDAYAIVVFDPFEETGKRIMLKQFDATHNEVSSGYYAFAEERYKYIDYIGMAVRGAREVALCTYEYNTTRSGGKSNRLVVSSFKNGVFEQHTIDSADELKKTEGIFCYNPTANLYQLLTVTAQGFKGGFFSASAQVFSSLILAINPDDYRVVWGGGLDGSKLDATKKEWYNKRAEYSGVPVYASVGADGSFATLTQEITRSTDGRSGTVSTYLGDIGVLRYSAKAEQTGATLVPAGLSASRASMGPLYLKGMDVSSAGVQQQRGLYLGSVADPGFYYFNYISTPKGNYVLLNQHPKDFDKEPAKTKGTLAGVSEANAVGYRIDGDKLEKFHLFGAPGGDIENRFALFNTGNYSEETGDYAVLMFQREGRRDKKLRVAWVHFK